MDTRDPGRLPDGRVPAPTSSDHENRRPIVCVFDNDQGTDALMHALSGLGYDAVDGRAGVPFEGCIAALVGTGYDQDLSLSQDLSRRCRVLLVGPEQSFGQRLEAARAGIGAVLATPLDCVELGAWLSDYASNAEEPPRHSILIIDDDELIAESYALALMAAGMDARVVTEPAEALSEIAEATPDLVLLDMHMPGANGLEVAQVIRQTRQTLSMPIVFLSAERDADTQSRARQIGGDDFISKPVNPDTVASIVRMRADRALALRQVMERDSLTGLLNHARFKERLTLELERSRRSGAPISVALIDIDHFKRVNDTYGHQTGDWVIQALSQCLAGSLRRTDVIARYGGEEFGIILLDTPIEAARAVMDRIRVQFSEITHVAGDQDFAATFSGGIAGFEPGSDTAGVIANADAALYRAKEAGRNRIVTA